MNRLEQLWEGWIAEALKPEEVSELQELFAKRSPEAIALIDELLHSGDYQGLADPQKEEILFQQILLRTRQSGTGSPSRRILLLRRIAAAAAVLLILATATFLLTRHKPTPDVVATHYKNDVAPGHSGAILHLSNGKTIVLDSAANGTVANEGGVEAIKSNGQLKYTGRTTQLVYNTISTDRGRQWQLTLPDGTRVWLNAASSIHYPLSFTGPEREVEITGEAYFEVSHNAKQPFKVKAGDQVIKDIGTAFNVNAYDDEPARKTTLVEGAVSVNGTALKPGQQAVLSNNQISVSAANVEQALAWKNGAFSFDNADIYTVMRQLSRWYNVDVLYEGKPDPAPFKGEMGRSLTLAQLLKVLGSLHVHFRIEEDKRIVILP